MCMLWTGRSGLHAVTLLSNIASIFGTFFRELLAIIEGYVDSFHTTGTNRFMRRGPLSTTSLLDLVNDGISLWLEAKISAKNMAHQFEQLLPSARPKTRSLRLTI